jgi:hypothetical protein
MSAARESAATQQVLARLQKLIEQSVPGSRLPSVRALMRVVGTSQPTVVRALDILERQGMLERRARSGIYSAQRPANRRRLILCGPNLFINPSPFSELLLHHLTLRYREHPDEVSVRFVNPSMTRVPDDEVESIVPPDLWAGLRLGAYGSVIVAGVEPRVVRPIEAIVGPTVGFGTSASYVIKMAMLEGVQLGVAQLVEKGCKRIALYHTPYISSREVFMAALRAHGAEEALVHHKLPFPRLPADQLIQPSRLVELGWQAARESFRSAASERPDGVLSMDDMFTQGFCSGLEESRRRIGRDVHVVSYGNEDSPVLWRWEKNLTQLLFSPRGIAEELHAAADRLQANQPLGPDWSHHSYTETGYTETTKLMRCHLVIQK